MATKAGRGNRIKAHAREGQERVHDRPAHGPCTFVVFGHVTFASAGAASTSATTIARAPRAIRR